MKRPRSQDSKYVDAKLGHAHTSNLSKRTATSLMIIAVLATGCNKTAEPPPRNSETELNGRFENPVFVTDGGLKRIESDDPIKGVQFECKRDCTFSPVYIDVDETTPEPLNRDRQNPSESSQTNTNNKQERDTEAPQQAVIQGDANVRKYPAITTHNIVGYGEPGDLVTLLRKSSGEENGIPWTFIRFQNGSEGWIRDDFLSDVQALNSNSYENNQSESKQKKSINNQPNDSATLQQAVIQGNVNVRKYPAITINNVIGYGQPGDNVTILKENPGEDGGVPWTFVRFQDGSEGWVRNDFL